jgi:hypothetical protein
MNQNQSITKNRTLIGLVGTAVLLCSCIPSVNPFYTDRDVIYDPRLPGVWRVAKSKGEPEVWKFESTTNRAYRLTVTDKDGKQGQFNAHLFQLKQGYFLDLIPADCEYATSQADLVAFSMFPGHLLVRVPQVEPQLKLAFFDFDWLEKFLEKTPKALAHHREGDRLLLTADTRDLQKFVLKHPGKDELFKEPDTMVRQTNPVSATAPPASP